MLPDKNIKCPATAFAKSCHAIVTSCTCPKFVNVRGRDPQTGEVFDRWGCVDGFLPLLLVECAQMARQTGAAVEAFRNEVVKANEAATEERRQALAGLARNGGRLLSHVE